MPPTMKASEAGSEFDAAVRDLDSVRVMQLLLDSIYRVPQGKKKAYAAAAEARDRANNNSTSTNNTDDDSTAQTDSRLSREEAVLLHLLRDVEAHLGFSFLRVSLRDAVGRDVGSRDWTGLTAVRRSEAGTTGIYFLQVTPHAQPLDTHESHDAHTATNTHIASTHTAGHPHPRHEVVVAKPMTAHEYRLVDFVDELTTGVFSHRHAQHTAAGAEQRQRQWQQQ